MANDVGAREPSTRCKMTHVPAVMMKRELISLPFQCAMMVAIMSDSVSDLA